jgi:uncharacterized protein
VNNDTQPAESARIRFADWTQGVEKIAYQTCASCLSTWYFRRHFCPGCGATAPIDRCSRGSGIVQAVTIVARAPSEKLRAYTPYCIVLVDLDEGFRMMAHGDKDLQIGDLVHARFVSVADLLTPYFERSFTPDLDKTSR